MQTFLPVKSFVRSMEFLDDKRLGKQRVEAAQILEFLLNEPILPKSLISVVPFDRSLSVWSRHPAVQMWSGYEEWLKLYLACAVGEWCCRGFANSIVLPSYDTSRHASPSWLGYERFHLSHRANLIRKNPSHYMKFWPEDRDDNLKYFWPTLNGFQLTRVA